MCTTYLMKRKALLEKRRCVEKAPAWGDLDKRWPKGHGQPWSLWRRSSEKASQEMWGLCRVGSNGEVS